MTEIRKQIKRKENIGKEKKGTKEENISPLQLRRSSRLRGMLKKVSSKGTKFINIEEETLVPSPDNVPFTHSPQNSPEPYFEGNPNKGSLGIGSVQQQIYDYIKSLEKKSASMDPKSSANPELPINPQEPLTDSLKQEIYELEILNRHIKKENETLKEQSKLDKAIHDNTILHLDLWYKKNRNLKRKNRDLNKTIINLKYRLLMKKPRMAVISKRSKRRMLDVLVEVSKQMQ